MTVYFLAILAPFLLLACLVLPKTGDRPVGTDNYKEMALRARVQHFDGNKVNESKWLPPEERESQQGTKESSDPGAWRLEAALWQYRASRKKEVQWLSLIVVVIVAFSSWLLVGRTLSPIRQLARQASAASVQNLQVHLIAPSRDAEVVELVSTLNDLLTRLSNTLEAKSRFNAAASHELRTPLQALTGHLELALSRSRTSQEYEAFLVEGYKQAQRLSGLVHDLLLLHQLDSAPVGPGVSIDLTELCDRALVQVQPLIEARSLRLRTNLPTFAPLTAVPTHAEILIRNLVENAVRYASPNGSVSVSLTPAAGAITLVVFNECAPTAIRLLPQTFEPFHRLDASRNSRTGGNGLGLAICQAITRANGWQMNLVPEPDGVRAIARFTERSTL